MRKILLLLLICGISKFLFCQELHSKEIEEIIEDIRILNLIKGLELDKSQAEFIVEKSKEAEKMGMAWCFMWYNYQYYWSVNFSSSTWGISRICRNVV